MGQGTRSNHREDESANGLSGRRVATCCWQGCICYAAATNSHKCSRTSFRESNFVFGSLKCFRPRLLLHEFGAFHQRGKDADFQSVWLHGFTCFMIVVGRLGSALWAVVLCVGAGAGTTKGMFGDVRTAGDGERRGRWRRACARNTDRG